MIINESDNKWRNKMNSSSIINFKKNSGIFKIVGIIVLALLLAGSVDAKQLFQHFTVEKAYISNFGSSSVSVINIK